MVVSAIEGRIRIRDEALREGETASLVEQALLECAGVERASANPRTGSLLVAYDAATTSVAAMAGVAADLLSPQAFQPGRGNGSRVRLTAVHFGMLASLALNLLAALSGAEGLHVVAGLGFLAFLAAHLSRFATLAHS